MEEKNKTQPIEKSKEIDIDKYTDIEGLSTKKLNFGLWIIEHRERLRTALIIFLVVVSAISWAYTIYGFAYYFARGMNEDEILIQELIQVNTIGHDYILKLSARDLVYFPVNILKASKDKYDLLVVLKNPNLKHMSVFEYCFLDKNETIDCAENFIFPGETKNLLSLAQEFTYKPTNIKFILKNIRWKRINLHKFPDWEKFKNDHLNISIVDIKFKPAKSSGLSEKLNLNSLEFTATNNTAYNYWEVPLIILLHNNNLVVGVNKYTLSEFMSGEKREIQMSWLGNISRVNNIKIIPEINIMLDDIYIKYEGGIGEEK